jgi:xanthine dehydrogenase accessory factor
MDIYKKIDELRKSNTPAALVTVVRTKGSVPREAGAKMIVLSDKKIYGTIGGSSVEGLIIDEAVTAIKSNKPVMVSHDLNDEEAKDTGMVCGGNMDFFIEPLNQMEHLYVFGGGHVALPLVQMAAKIGFDVLVIDDRAEFASKERFPESSDCYVTDPGIFSSDLETTDRDYIVIVTRGHKDDYAVLKGVIKKPFRYLGMIGSKVKKKEIYTKLKENDDVTEAMLEKVHCPIGLPIGAETPEEIAVSILAELVQERRKNQK